MFGKKSCLPNIQVCSFTTLCPAFRASHGHSGGVHSPTFTVLLCSSSDAETGNWLVFNTPLPGESGICGDQGILQVRAGVRGFARSIALSRLSPCCAWLSDLLPLRLFLLPQTISDYWYLRNAQSSLLSSFCFCIRLVMVFWLKFPHASNVWFFLLSFLFWPT